MTTLRMLFGVYSYGGLIFLIIVYSSMVLNYHYNKAEFFKTIDDILPEHRVLVITLIILLSAFAWPLVVVIALINYLSLRVKDRCDDMENVVTSQFTVVDTLPKKNINTTTVYLIPQDDAVKLYKGFIYIENDWQCAGYFNESELNECRF